MVSCTHPGMKRLFRLMGEKRPYYEMAFLPCCRTPSLRSLGLAALLWPDVVVVVVVVLTLTHRINAVRGHRTGSNNNCWVHVV